MAESPVDAQIKALQELIVSPRRRVEFLQDASAYGKKYKITFDSAVADMTGTALLHFEQELARLGTKNPHIRADSPLLAASQNVFPEVRAARGLTTAAATAVVSAAAAVVSAAAAVTQATSAAKSRS